MRDTIWCVWLLCVLSVCIAQLSRPIVDDIQVDVTKNKFLQRTASETSADKRCGLLHIWHSSRADFRIYRPVIFLFCDMAWTYCFDFLLIITLLSVCVCVSAYTGALNLSSGPSFPLCLTCYKKRWKVPVSQWTWEEDCFHEWERKQFSLTIIWLAYRLEDLEIRASTIAAQWQHRLSQEPNNNQPGKTCKREVVHVLQWRGSPDQAVRCKLGVVVDDWCGQQYLRHTSHSWSQQRWSIGHHSTSICAPSWGKLLQKSSYGVMCAE